MEDWVAGLADAAKASVRPVEGELSLPGIAGEVEIVTDRWGVPHVYAAHTDDLYAAQGYLHATERLWQTDFTARLARGRLSALVGETAWPLDRFFRTIGLGRIAERLVPRLDDRSREIARAYAAGFAAGAASQPAPVEYQLLASEPEIAEDPHEQLVNGLAIGLFLSFQLSTNWPFELMRAELARRVGPERARELTPLSPAESPVVVPQSATFPGMVAELISTALGAGGGRSGVGSNNWAVAGAKSVTGKPILCNDPHLLVQMPAIWYQVHLSAPDLEVRGVSLPGLPGVLLGHNRRIAWGFTNTGADVEDLCLERLSEDGLRYEVDGEWHDVEVVREEIQVLGEAEPRVHEVRVTRNGPLLTDTIRGTLNPQVVQDAITMPLALRWVQADIPVQQSAIEALNTAGSWEEFREAARRWPAAGQNMVYADVDGSIGYQCTGAVPIRRRGAGAAPLPGWSTDYDWNGTIPFDDLPSVLNPPAGFVATANHRLVDFDYPYYLTNDWEPPHRIRRIVSLLTERERLGLDDMARIQTDTHSGIADELVPLLLAAPAPADPVATAARDVVASWDRRMDADSAGAAVFTVWVYCLSEALFRGPLGDELFDAYHATKSWTTAWAYDAIRSILRNPQGFWVGGDGDNVAARDALVGRALGNACDYLTERLGPDRSDWRWGSLHTITFGHPIAQALPPLADLLSIGPFEAPGGDDTINRGVFTPGEGYADAAVASYRQIIDLADLDRSLAVITVGQSGNPASPHHHDLAELWLNGRYHPMPFTRAAVDAASEGRMVLTPKG